VQRALRLQFDVSRVHTCLFSLLQLLSVSLQSYFKAGARRHASHLTNKFFSLRVKIYKLSEPTGSDLRQLSDKVIPL